MINYYQTKREGGQSPPPEKLKKTPDFYGILDQDARIPGNKRMYSRHGYEDRILSNVFVILLIKNEPLTQV